MTDVTTLKLIPLPVPLPLDLGAPNTVIRVIDKPNSYPCRRCLTDGIMGEEMVLLSYDPFTGTSPYRGAGPIFVHRHECDLYKGNEIPEQQRRRLLALRGYDQDHMMQQSSVVDGTELEDSARKIFEDQKVQYVHVHNAKPGCFALRLERGAME